MKIIKDLCFKSEVIVCVFIFCFFLAGCSLESKASQSPKVISISRSFEDLSLGMILEDFKNRVIYDDISGYNTPEISKVYEVYSHYYNIYKSERNYSGKEKLKMKELQNIYNVYCSFFDNKLYRIEIHYKDSYHPFWVNFIHNTKEKYGDGQEDYILKKISWDDGETELIIREEAEEQIGHGYPEAYPVYVVVYLDNEIYSQMSSKEQEQSPKL